MTLAYNDRGDARIEVEATPGDADPRPLVENWSDMRHWFVRAGLEGTAKGTCDAVGSIRSVTVTDLDGTTYKLYGTCTHYSTADGTLTERFRFGDIPDVPVTVRVRWMREAGDTHQIRVDVPLAVAPPAARGKLEPRVVRLHEVLELLMRYLSANSFAS